MTTNLSKARAAVRCFSSTNSTLLSTSSSTPASSSFPLIQPPLTSFGFSGGGFLACYHLGAAHCLVQQGWLLSPGQLPSSSSNHHSLRTLLTGVSAGSLVIGAVAAGTDLEVGGMEACKMIAQRSQQIGGYLDCLKPGFSLVDQVEDILPRFYKQALGGGSGMDDDDDYDNDLFLRRIDGGRLIRIGLTDHRAVFPPIGYNPNAYVYVDGYRDIDDLVAACVLSCFVPGLTGPAVGAWSAQNGAVGRAYERIQQMAALGFIKQGTTGQPMIQPRGSRLKVWQSREAFWDGGLVNVFPVVDDDTVIVSPIAGNYAPHRSISPDPRQLTAFRREPLIFRFNPRAQIYLSPENALTFRYMLLSSDDNALQQRFQQGYDEAKRFLRQQGLLRTFQLPSTAVATTPIVTTTVPPSRNSNSTQTSDDAA